MKRNVKLNADQYTVFNATFSYKLIYIFRINDEKHKGVLKIGEATIHTSKSFDKLPCNCRDLNEAAKSRINDYTTTAGIQYELLHTEVAVFVQKNKNSKYFGKTLFFRDHDVHNVLKRSGIKRKFFDTTKQQNEWFYIDLETAKKAITAVKNCKTALDNSEISNDINPIIFRPEQNEAINKTIIQFKENDDMLWNAKMRFGKTLSALQVVKLMSFKKTIIITHRPAVSDSWFDDFKKIFYDKKEYEFASKNVGKSITELIKRKRSFVYFASIQDLRGSEKVGGNFDKNDEIFSIDWDFVVIDEAHEGTKTPLGKAVKELLVKRNNNYTTKVLELSGTPFNLLDDYQESNIYTWDYIMEQEAKTNWYLNHYGDSNPYEELPKMNIFTYHLEEMIKGYMEIEDKAFNFREFFRVWTGDLKKDGIRLPLNKNIGDFVHEKDIESFLNLLVKKGEKSNYPFSTEEYRNYFRHSLWMLPGVKEAKALSKMLHKHPVFGSGAFQIVNVAGEGDEEQDSRDALQAVRNAIGNHPEDTYTITLSCGRLTTGVSVPEWTAVFMLSGSYSVAASQYLQTIFRVQTPANINGKMKENCYVFDFAPDRTLKMVAESVQISARTNVGVDAQYCLQKFLNFCPVISISNSQMKEYKVSNLLQELKKSYSERVVKNGFDDTSLYNEALLNLDGIQLQEFEELKKIIGSSKKQKGIDNIVINDEGINNEQYEKIKELEKKKKKDLTDEEKEILEADKKRKENRVKAIQILRSISIRIPLLVYGIDKNIDEDITIDNFVDMIDELSWQEFMPDKVDKPLFKKFIKYYDKDIFVASTRRIRMIAKYADELEPTERVYKITSLFSTFKNPDKETILTPWKVVNMHLSNTIGGYDFYDEDHENLLNTPRFVDKGVFTSETLCNKNANLLEINSKTGLYPLYLAYSLYRNYVSTDSKLSFDEKYEIWDKVVRENVFVVCKTEMAKQITKRTLVGYRNADVNTRYFVDLVNKMSQKQKLDNFIYKIHRGKSYWGRKEKTDNMKFNAVVGNPPYQGTNHQQIYTDFYLTSRLVGDVVSLIFPIGWQQPKNANNLGKLNTEEIKTDKQIVFIDNRKNVFPGVSGAEWVNIMLWKKGYDNNLNGLQLIYTDGDNPIPTQLLWSLEQIEKPNEIKILSEIVRSLPGFVSIQSITSALKPYGLRTDVIKDSKKYGLEPLQEKRVNEDDINVYAKSGLVLYVPRNYKFPKVTKSFDKYKVFVPYAWGNMSEKTGLGGAYSDIIVAKPYEVCTETYLESGCFDDENTAYKHAKYLMTNFARALLYLNKFSQHSTTSWGAIPLQDYCESWWDLSIHEINEKLFDKYNVPDEIRKFVNENIQVKYESNILK